MLEKSTVSNVFSLLTSLHFTTDAYPVSTLQNLDRHVVTGGDRHDS
jgi:hypothetical protein